MEEIFKEEWQDWKSNKVTYAFLATLRDKREFLKEGLANASHGTEKERLIDIGQCIALLDSIDYAKEGFNYIEKESNEP